MSDINLDRITKNKADILDIQQKIHEIVDKDKKLFLNDARNPLSLKYMLIQAVEAITDSCQHILAKSFGAPCVGYSDCIDKAEKKNIISAALAEKLKKLVNLRNALIHRYWIIDDEKLLELTKDNIKDLKEFTNQIDNYISNEFQSE